MRAFFFHPSAGLNAFDFFGALIIGCQYGNGRIGFWGFVAALLLLDFLSRRGERPWKALRRERLTGEFLAAVKREDAAS
jgi:hypothetical protein